MIYKDDSRAIQKYLKSYGIDTSITKKTKCPAYTRYTLKFKQRKHIQGIFSDNYIANGLAIYLHDLHEQKGLPYLRFDTSREEDSILSIEIPNTELEVVTFKKMLEKYKKSKLNYKLPIFLGVDGENKEHFADLTELENILMAGSTGGGKSVFNENIICSLITKYKQEELRVYIADVKRVEFTMYNGLPHLIDNVHVDCEDVLSSLGRLIVERTKRDFLFKQSRVKGFNEYNVSFSKEKMPYILIIIDTFSDLMAYAPVRFENILSQILPNSAKFGMHMIICDARPSVDVFTKVVRDAFATKIAFNLSSDLDSVVALGQRGAERLLGRGDMLMLKKNERIPIRLQAPLISEKEILKICKGLRNED